MARENLELPPRVDPKPRPADGVQRADRMRVLNADPTMHYVGVHKNAIADYEDLGYVATPRVKGGAQWRGANGDAAVTTQECQGHVLMQIPADVLADIRLNGGADGSMGTAHYDRIEKQILDGQGHDPTRGLHSQYVQGVTSGEMNGVRMGVFDTAETGKV